MTSGKRARALRQADAQHQAVGKHQAGGKRPGGALQALEARRRRVRVFGAAATVVVLAGAGIGVGLAASGSGGSASSGSATSTNAGGSPKLALGSLSSLGALQPAGSPGPAGPEGVPVPSAAPLASTVSAAVGQTVDGIPCQTSEQTLFHIHAHLTIFVDGAPRQIPDGIGIPGAQAQSTPHGPFVTSGKCFYWLHTHAADGIIHIESPVQRTYTLGQFFDEWGQPLGPNQVGPASGHVVALYDGKLYRGNPRDIPLHAHAQIQLDVGTPLVAPETISFPNGL